MGMYLVLKVMYIDGDEVLFVVGIIFFFGFVVSM